MGFVFTKLTRYILVIFLIYNGTNYVLRNISYNISPKLFKSISSKSAEVKTGNVKNIVSTLTSGLRNSYNSLLPQVIEWHSLQLGNHDLKFFPFYLSMTEYAAVIGTPYASSGRIGFHWSNSTCTVLTGTVSRFRDSAFIEEKASFNSGDNFRHGEFESYVYNFAQDTYVSCYGRGVVPLSGFWAGISGISHGEPLSVGKMYFTFLHTIYDRIMMRAFQTFNHYKSRATGKVEL